MGTIVDDASEERQQSFAFAKCLLMPEEVFVLRGGGTQAVVAACPAAGLPADVVRLIVAQLRPVCTLRPGSLLTTWANKDYAWGHSNNANIPATPGDRQLILGDRGLIHEMVDRTLDLEFPGILKSAVP